MIYEFYHEKIMVPLVGRNFHNNSENVYTIIIGKNGLGKSRLLSSLAKFGSMKNAETKPYYFGDHPIAKVIAVSTSPFDKFPLPAKGDGVKSRNSRIDSESEDIYRYVGMKSRGFTSTSPISLISSAAKGLLENHLNRHDNYRLNDAFELLGFSPEVEFVFKVNRVGDKIGYTLDDGNGLSNGAEISFDRIHHLEDINDINRILSYTDHNSNFSIGFSLASNSFQVKGQSYYDHDFLVRLTRLLDRNIIRLMDLRLHKYEHGRISLRRASSGEQCIIVSMLGIAGHIVDDSLILIDEPEISLHPEWQQEYMKILVKAFENYRRCQFVIATHSPKIIASLPDGACYVLSLSLNEIFDANQYRNTSSDYQLVELFESPGSRNEYLSRLALNLFVKINKTKKFDHSDGKALEKLKNAKNKIATDDPVFDLIKTLIEMNAYYGND